MNFRPCTLAGAFILETERTYDQRGYFARTFCEGELATRGLETHIAQCSVSMNLRAGTLRGMHYQVAPDEETKLVRCIRGEIYDVLLDLRPESPTFKVWEAVELSASNGWAVYIPAGIAHGFQTLVENSEVLYQISTSYRSESARGVRWDDPEFGIRWPECDLRTISDRDRGFATFGQLARSVSA